MASRTGSVQLGRQGSSAGAPGPVPPQQTSAKPLTGTDQANIRLGYIYALVGKLSSAVEALPDTLVVKEDARKVMRLVKRCEVLLTDIQPYMGPSPPEELLAVFKGLQDSLSELLGHVKAIAAKGPLAVLMQADRTLTGFEDAVRRLDKCLAAITGNLPEETLQELERLRGLLARTRFALPAQHQAVMDAFRGGVDRMRAAHDAAQLAVRDIVRAISPNGADQLTKEGFHEAMRELVQENDFVLQMGDPHGDSLYLRTLLDCLRVHHVAAGEAPLAYVCPLSFQVMHDPVIVAGPQSSGFSYERAAIEAWHKKGHRVCPRSGKPLGGGKTLPLVSNTCLKEAIDSWRLYGNLSVAFRPLLQTLSEEPKMQVQVAATRERLAEEAVQQAEDSDPLHRPPAPAAANLSPTPVPPPPPPAREPVPALAGPDAAAAGGLVNTELAAVDAGFVAPVPTPPPPPAAGALKVPPLPGAGSSGSLAEAPVPSAPAAPGLARPPAPTTALAAPPAPTTLAAAQPPAFPQPPPPAAVLTAPGALSLVPPPPAASPALPTEPPAAAAHQEQAALVLQSSASQEEQQLGQPGVGVAQSNGQGEEADGDLFAGLGNVENGEDGTGDWGDDGFGGFVHGQPGGASSGGGSEQAQEQGLQQAVAAPPDEASNEDAGGDWGDMQVPEAGSSGAGAVVEEPGQAAVSAAAAQQGVPRASDEYGEFTQHPEPVQARSSLPDSSQWQPSSRVSNDYGDFETAGEIGLPAAAAATPIDPLDPVLDAPFPPPTATSAAILPELAIAPAHDLAGGDGWQGAPPSQPAAPAPGDALQDAPAVPADGNGECSSSAEAVQMVGEEGWSGSLAQGAGAARASASDYCGELSSTGLQQAAREAAAAAEAVEPLPEPELVLGVAGAGAVQDAAPLPQARVSDEFTDFVQPGETLLQQQGDEQQAATAAPPLDAFASAGPQDTSFLTLPPAALAGAAVADAAPGIAASELPAAGAAAAAPAQHDDAAAAAAAATAADDGDGWGPMDGGWGEEISLGGGVPPAPAPITAALAAGVTGTEGGGPPAGAFGGSAWSAAGPSSAYGSGAHVDQGAEGAWSGMADADPLGAAGAGAPFLAATSVLPPPAPIMTAAPSPQQFGEFAAATPAPTGSTAEDQDPFSSILAPPSAGPVVAPPAPPPAATHLPAAPAAGGTGADMNSNDPFAMLLDDFAAPAKPTQPPAAADIDWGQLDRLE